MSSEEDRLMAADDLLASFVAQMAPHEAAFKELSVWPDWLPDTHCARCLQPVDVDGVDPSLCTDCERRSATRTTVFLLVAMVVLSIAMIILGRIS